MEEKKIDQNEKPKPLFRPPAVRVPEQRHIKEIGNKLHLDVNQDEIANYTELAGEFLGSWNSVYFETTTGLRAEYSRRVTSFYPDSDNIFYYKCKIDNKREGLLCDKSLGVKDTVFIAGLPLMNGSHLIEGFTPNEDATIVSRLLDAGIDIIGKTHCEDLCFSGASFTCARGPVNNSFIDGYNSCGSSSGSASGVAKGLIDIAIAGDQGGSIRLPSASNGVIGLKPTFGLIPYTNVMGLDYTLDHVGPIARRVEDICKFMQVTVGPDDYDSRYYKYLKYSQFNSDAEDEEFKQLKKKKSEFEKSIKFGISKAKVDFMKAYELYQEIIPNLKVGVLKEGFANLIESEAKMYKTSFDHLRHTLNSKHKIEFNDVSCDAHITAGVIIFIFFVEGFYNFYENDFVSKSTFQKDSFELAKHVHASKQVNTKDISHSNKLFFILGEYIKEKYGSRFWAKANDIRIEVFKKYQKLFEEYDLIIMPTLKKLPSSLPKNDLGIKEYFDIIFGHVGNTCPYNVNGNPALTINYGAVEKLCPVMIVGRHFEDHRVLQFARLIENLK